MSTILCIDDEPLLRRYLRTVLVRMGHAVVEADDGQAGLEAAAQPGIDLVITDLRMPTLDGFGVLAGLRRMKRRIPALVLTSSDRIADAVTAIKAGAVDFLPKPVHEAQFEQAVRLALGARDERGGDGLGGPGGAVIGESAAMRDLLEQVQQVGATDATVLITGETGTGKEVVARLLHAASRRSAERLVVVNCGAIPDGLIESVLFGHAKGAFTGAVQRQVGMFVAADRGTLFLDEVAELPKAAQAKLLRALQQREVTPVGESEAVRVDIRVIAATHRDLEQMVDEGAFRQDLYYRLAVVPLDVPPLRERPEDLAPLVHHLLDAACVRLGRPIEIADETIDALALHDFPGNVRELENLIERLVVTARRGTIEPDDLPDKIRGAARPAARPVELGSGAPRRFLDDILRETEDKMIDDAIRQAGGNRTLAAQLLGINRTTLVAKLKRRS